MLTIHSEHSRRDAGIRTPALLLPNQLRPAARRSLMPPYVAFTWDDAGWASPDVGWCLCTLAPTLAPTLMPLGIRVKDPSIPGHPARADYAIMGYHEGGAYD
jgi:hypothetical protein